MLGGGDDVRPCTHSQAWTPRLPGGPAGGRLPWAPAGAGRQLQPEAWPPHGTGWAGPQCRGRTGPEPPMRLAQARPTPRAHMGVPTLLHRRVGVGEEAEVPLVVPADQGHVALHLDAVLAPGGRRGRVGQHGQRQARAVTLPGAEQAAAVNPWGGRGHKTARCHPSPWRRPGHGNAGGQEGDRPSETGVRGTGPEEVPLGETAEAWGSSPRFQVSPEGAQSAGRYM